MRRPLAAWTVLAATLCSSAAAGNGLLVGVSEDGMKWSPERGRLTARHMYRLGIGAVRVTFRWSPGQTVPRQTTLIALHRAVRTAGRRRLVLAVARRDGLRSPPFRVGCDRSWTAIRDETANAAKT